MFDFCITYDILLANLLRCLALKSSTTCSWVSAYSCSGVLPLKLYFWSPFSFFWTVDIVDNNISNIYINDF